MNDLREDFRRAADAAPPLPDVWHGHDKRVNQARNRRRLSALATATVVLAVTASAAIGWNPLRTPDLASASATSTTAKPTIPDATPLPSLRGAPRTWKVSALSEAIQTGVEVPSTGTGSWTSSPESGDGVLLWKDAGIMGLPGVPSQNPISFGRGEKVLQTDDLKAGVTYLHVWPTSGGDWLLAVRADKSTRGHLLANIAQATLGPVLGASTTQ